jgi:hypothetical protein
MTLSNGYAWYVMKKLIHFEVLKRIQIIAGASIAVGVTTKALSLLGVPVVVNIAAGAGVYVFVLWILREPIVRDVWAIAQQNVVPTETEAA